MPAYLFLLHLRLYKSIQALLSECKLVKVASTNPSAVASGSPRIKEFLLFALQRDVPIVAQNQVALSHYKALNQNDLYKRSILLPTVRIIL